MLAGFMFTFLSCSMPGSEKVKTKEAATTEAAGAQERREHRLAMARKPLPVLMIGSFEVIEQLAKRLPIGR